MNYVNILASDLCTSEAGYRLFGFAGYILEFIQIAVPIILIVVGTIELLKALMAQSQDQMKKAQSSLIKKVIYGVVIFFVPMAVKFIFSMVNSTNDDSIVCLQSFNDPKGAMAKADELKQSKDTVGSIVGNNISPEVCESKGGTPITDEVRIKLYGTNCRMNPDINLDVRISKK